MNTSRTGMLVAAALSVLLGAGCTNTASTASKPSGPTSSSASSSAPGSSANEVASVEVAIITAMSADSVTWVDGEIVPATGNDRAVKRLPGPEHVHTAPIAGDAMFFLALDRDGAVSVDDAGLGTAPVDRAEFAKQVVGDDLSAAKIVFDDQGRVIRVATRYRP